jgi:hypothetical protein
MNVGNIAQRNVLAILLLQVSADIACEVARIMQTPGFLEPVIPAGALWPPLALREGSKTSLVYLNSGCMPVESLRLVFLELGYL